MGEGKGIGWKEGGEGAVLYRRWIDRYERGREERERERERNAQFSPLLACFASSSILAERRRRLHGCVRSSNDLFSACRFPKKALDEGGDGGVWGDEERAKERGGGRARLIG